MAWTSIRSLSMPKPISRRELIRRFRALGRIGPFPGGKHAVMEKSNRTTRIPNSHRGDIDWSLAKRILRQAEINPDEWEKLG